MEEIHIDNRIFTCFLKSEYVSKSIRKLYCPRKSRYKHTKLTNKVFQGFKRRISYNQVQTMNYEAI